MEGERMFSTQEGISEQMIDQKAASLKEGFDQWARMAEEDESVVDYTVLKPLCELSLGIENSVSMYYQGWTPEDFKKLLDKIATFNEAYANAIEETLQTTSEMRESIPGSAQEAAVYLVEHNNVEGTVKYLRENKDKIEEFCEQVTKLSNSSGEIDANLIEDAFAKVLNQLI